VAMERKLDQALEDARLMGVDTGERQGRAAQQPRPISGKSSSGTSPQMGVDPRPRPRARADAATLTGSCGGER
jgi:hypothetical protein